MLATGSADLFCSAAVDWALPPPKINNSSNLHKQILVYWIMIHKCTHMQHSPSAKHGLGGTRAAGAATGPVLVTKPAV